MNANTILILGIVFINALSVGSIPISPDSGLLWLNIDTDPVDLSNTKKARNEKDPRNFRASYGQGKLVYLPLALIKQSEFETFRNNIELTGEAKAKCKADFDGDGVPVQFEVHFKTHSYDDSSKVFFGTGHEGDDIPCIKKETVIIVDCNNAHPDVCLIGSSTPAQLPFKTKEYRRRSLESGNKKATIADYTYDARSLSSTAGSLRGRTLLEKNSEKVWELDEVVKCWFVEYRLIGYNSGHSALGFVPVDESSSCPTIGAHTTTQAKDEEEDGKTDQDQTLIKSVFIIENLPSGVTFDFGVRMLLRDSRKGKLQLINFNSTFHHVIYFR